MNTLALKKILLKHALLLRDQFTAPSGISKILYIIMEPPLLMILHIAKHLSISKAD